MDKSFVFILFRIDYITSNLEDNGNKITQNKNNYIGINNKTITKNKLVNSHQFFKY